MYIRIELMFYWVVILIGFICLYCIGVLFVGKNILFVNGFKIFLNVVNFCKEINKMKLIVRVVFWWGR